MAGDKVSLADRNGLANAGDAAPTANLTATLCGLSWPTFLVFWRRIMQDSVDVAEHLRAYMALLGYSAPEAEAAPGNAFSCRV